MTIGDWYWTGEDAEHVADQIAREAAWDVSEEADMWARMLLDDCFSPDVLEVVGDE